MSTFCRPVVLPTAKSPDNNTTGLPSERKHPCPALGWCMDTDRRDLVNRLFAEATALLEDATETTVAGQSPNLMSADCMKFALKVHRVAREISALAEASLIVAGIDFDNMRRRRG